MLNDGKIETDLLVHKAGAISILLKATATPRYLVRTKSPNSYVSFSVDEQDSLVPYVFMSLW